MAAPFRLARVLRLREQIRRLRSHEAEQLAARLAALRAALLHLRAERERLGMAEALEAVAGRLTPEALQLGRGYDAALAAAERARAAEIVQVGQLLDAKRAELVRDRQEEEKYVRLAAAHRQRVTEEEAHETARLLDEVAVDRFRRQQKERRHDQV